MPTHSSNWDYYGTKSFGERTGGVAVLPIYGIAANGLGLGWDIEETVSSNLICRSIAECGGDRLLTVLPPLRLSLAPYQDSLSGTDADTLYTVVKELAVGIKSTGYNKLVLWSSHPWNTEIVDVVSRDIRIELDLQTFVIELGGLDLSLHPRFPSERARVQTLAVFLTGKEPVDEPDGEPTDPEFRPGNWSVLPSIDPTLKTESAEHILAAAVTRLSRLWVEILNRPLLNGVSAKQHDAPQPSRTASHVSATPAIVRPDAKLSSLSGSEIARVAADEGPLVILPIGAVEQHGPHLPVGVDTMIAEAAATGLKARLGDSVRIQPTLAYGKSNEHADFPGTVGMSARSLRQILKSQISNLYELGFRQFAVLNTHGGNSSVLTYVLREIQTEMKVRAGMLRLPLSAEMDEQESTWGFHAGEWETSVMLAIKPDVVQMDQAICHYPASLDDPGELRPENAPAIFSWKTRDIAPEGVMGDATKATEAKGHRWFNDALDQVAEQVRKLLASYSVPGK